MIPRRADQAECQSRLRERLGPSADPESVNRYFDKSRRPTIYDRSVLAITVPPEQSRYTLPQILMVFPNIESFYSEGATIDRISDRLWIMHSDMSDSPARTALVEDLTTGFFNDEALSHCPEVPPGSPLSLRNTHRLERLKKKDDMKGSRYYRFTTVEPAHGPRNLLGEDSASAYNIAAFGRLIDAHASHSWGPAHSIETIEYAPRTHDRLKLYRRLALRQFPTICHGNTTVILSSPSHAPDYFDIVSNDMFPGELAKMKRLVIDASIGSTPQSAPNISQEYSSPHLQSVTFRLQDRLRDNAVTGRAEGVTAVPDEDVEGEHVPESKDLVAPLYGSAARVIFTPGPESAHLSDLCDQATTDAASGRNGEC